MTLSVIIPTLNEQNYIGDLLKDLCSQTSKPDEIIVIDGNSQDKTLKVVSCYKNIKVKVTQKGVGLQRRTGGSLARGHLLIFLDADVRLKDRFLEVVIKNFTDKKLDIAVPLYLPYKSTYLISAVYWFFNIIFIVTEKFLPSGAGSCLIVKKSLLNKVGSFNPELTYDDIEFIRRAGKRGKFGVINQPVYVSDRRFRKYGTIKMFILYLTLYIFFSFGLFKQANMIKYKFSTFR